MHTLSNKMLFTVVRQLPDTVEFGKLIYYTASVEKEKKLSSSLECSMNENCVAMPPTTTDRESSKSPSGSHSIDDILGIKAITAGNSAQLVGSQHQPEAMYNGSDSSSDSSSNSDDRESSPSLPAAMETSRSPPPLQQHQAQPQQLLQMTTLTGAASPSHLGSSQAHSQGEQNTMERTQS